MPKKFNIAPGTWIGVPIDNGGWCIGLVTHTSASSKGRLLFGRFFSPRLESVPTMKDVADVRQEAEIYRALFGDLALSSGAWIVIGSDQHWTSSKWPLPSFFTESPILSSSDEWRYTLITLDEADLAKEKFTADVRREDVEVADRFGVDGTSALEHALSWLFGSHPLDTMLPGGKRRFPKFMSDIRLMQPYWKALEATRPASIH